VTDADARRLADYDERLSAVMPPDFKDWHENARDEWPIVAAMTIKSLQERVQMADNFVVFTCDAAQKEMDKLRDEVKRLTPAAPSVTVPETWDDFGCYCYYEDGDGGCNFEDNIYGHCSPDHCPRKPEVKP
jgi:hypothetical protein